MPAGMRRRIRATSEQGQSVTETMLLTWLMLIFFAAALQIFIMNESLFRMLTTTHAQMFQSAFQHNGWKQGDRYKYDTDLNAKVIWRREDFPEVRVQVLNIFSAWRWRAGSSKANAGFRSIDIQSSVHPPEPSKGCDKPCKKIKMAAGAAGPTDEPKEYWTRPFDFRAYGRLVKQAFNSVRDAL
jgi:hypothetical protein